MKATGIVRRIDELGRVVIPKEIRRTLRLSSGDPLEIFTDKDELLFKKYSPIKSIDGFAVQFSEGLREVSGYRSAICDTDTVLSSGQKDIEGRRISAELERAIRDRRTIVINSLDDGIVIPIVHGDDRAYTAQVISPVIAEGDCIGACILFSDEPDAKMRESDVKLARISADLIARRFSE